MAAATFRALGRGLTVNRVGHDGQIGLVKDASDVHSVHELLDLFEQKVAGQHFVVVDHLTRAASVGRVGRRQTEDVAARAHFNLFNLACKRWTTTNQCGIEFVRQLMAFD